MEKHENYEWVFPRVKAVIDRGEWHSNEIQCQDRVYGGILKRIFKKYNAYREEYTTVSYESGTSNGKYDRKKIIYDFSGLNPEVVTNDYIKLFQNRKDGKIDNSYDKEASVIL